MPIVQAKCENCGGVLAVDDSQKAAVCPFCNTPYVVQDAINNYNITNNIKVESGATVNIYGSANNDFEIEAGVLKKYKGAATDVVIPDSVTEIGEEVFAHLPITSITIPDSVKRIGFGAFANCTSLKDVYIPSVSSWCSINFEFATSNPLCTNICWPTNSLGYLHINGELATDITIPNNITRIGKYTFLCCKSLTNVTIPNCVISIGEEAFSFCTSLKSIVIPDSVTNIEKKAFDYCSSLESITIPDSVLNIEKDAFDRCPNITFNCSSTVKALIDKSNESRKQKSNGCYVATAVYGSYDCPQVWTLRRYRDYRLDATWYGRLFIMLYYAISPALVKWFGHTEWFKKMWKGRLDRMVERLQNEGYEDTPYNDKY